MIRRLLVANRAEIASRVFRTCRGLGIETVAVHSDADALLPYVAEADVAVALPGSAPADTYLRADLLIDAARRSGADAVHPGYGFLSENADFARAVADAGLTWVGPSPESMEQMGSKIEAKQIMGRAGVPVLVAPSEPAEADLPLLVKASAGGGGRGMRVVRTLLDLPAAVAEAQAEALSAFGDGTVFVEPYVERGRHVEVQVVGHHEGVLVLGERDCSIQRRHQKVVEESPAPRLPDGTRAALHEAARAAATAIGYLGAGTVEFLYDGGEDAFYFLEMNTRLQVEHPVTELVFGVDLVELQLRVAEGGGLEPLGGARRSTGAGVGHAIEVRLYAEDPAAGHQPQSGVLSRFEIPTGDGVRVDAGYVTGSTVSTHYDAMLAKVIAWAPTRAQAARRLADALTRARIHGVATNRDLLVGVLRSAEFLTGEVTTAFLDGRTFVPPDPTLSGDERSSNGGGARAAAAIALAARAGAARTVQRGIPVGWRNVTSQPQRTELDTGTVEWWGTGDGGYRVEGFEVVEVLKTRSPDDWAVTLEADGVLTSYDAVVSTTGPVEVVDVDSVHGHLRCARVPRFTDPAAAVAGGSLVAPMPGAVVRVVVAEGDAVEAGQPVLVLEAMKMQHTMAAPHAGVITRLDAVPGAQVVAGQVLALVSTDSTDATDSTGSTDEEEQA